MDLRDFGGDAKFEYITEDSVRKKAKTKKRSDKEDVSIGEGISKGKT